MATKKKPFFAQKMNGQTIQRVQDWIVHEAPLQININGKPYTVVMRTPGTDHALIKGLFYTENIISDDHREIKIIYDDEGNLASVWINPEYLKDGYYQSRSLVSVSSCGICGKRELTDLELHADSLKTGECLSSDQIQQMFMLMEQKQSTFLQTGGTHAAACFDRQGELLSIQEDIGRHNAVDKVVGDLLEQDHLKKAKCLLVSGRISYEIVCKCFKAGIPFLAAVSSPSSMSIEIAEKKGITLMGFCRGTALTCYSHPYRLIQNKNESLHV